MHFNLCTGSFIQLSHSDFLSNHSYLPATFSLYPNSLNFLSIFGVADATLSDCSVSEGENYSSNLFADLMTAQLINESTDLSTDFLNFPSQIYDVLLRFQSWGEVRVTNVTVQKSTHYVGFFYLPFSLANAALFLDSVLIRDVKSNSFSFWKGPRLGYILSPFRTFLARQLTYEAATVWTVLCIVVTVSLQTSHPFLQLKSEGLECKSSTRSSLTWTVQSLSLLLETDT